MGYELAFTDYYDLEQWRAETKVSPRLPKKQTMSEVIDAELKQYVGT